MKLATLLQKTGVKKLLVAAGAALVVTGGVFAFATHSDAASCPTNDIMPCGAKNASDFASKLKKNSTKDMDKIYAHYDLSKADYDTFARYAKKGVINPDTGNVTVDGVTVMKDARSLGRNSKGSISKAVTINGKKYYETPIRLLTKYNNDAMVLFDAKGNVQTVVMNLCGNPMTNTEVNPKYNCDALNVTPVDRDTFKFSSNISSANGATVTKVVYDFGDGQTRTETKPSTVVTHKYTKPGNYTAKVTAYVKTKFGRGEFPITVTANCKKTLTVKEAEKPNIDITKTVDVTEVEVGKPFNYTIKVTNTGNITLKDAKVTDTPATGSNIQLLSSNGIGSISGNTWTYTIPELQKGESKSFTLTAKVTKYTAGNLVNTVCVDTPTIKPSNPDDCDDATVKTTPPVYACETLHSRKITRNNFEFSTDASASKGASIAKVVYDFGDGSQTVSRTNPSDKVTHTYDRPGNYTAKVAVHVAIVGEGTKVIEPAGACTVPITVEEEPKPKVEIDKKVENVEHKVVGLNTVYTYQIAVSNKGNITLKNVDVTDTPVAGITLLQGSAGTVSGNTWTYTIPELQKGETKHFTLTAKVPTYLAGTLKNTVCVDAEEIPGTKDDCDDATVEVPAPVYTCDSLTVQKIEHAERRVTFTARGTADKGAVISGYRFDFGDGTSQTVTSSAATATATRTYAAHGEYTARVTVLIKVGSESKEVTSAKCAVKFTIDAPKVPHVKIEKFVNGKKHDKVVIGQNYTYTIKVTNDGELTLKGVKVTDTPKAGSNIQLVSAAVGTISGNVWTYTIPELKVGESKSFTLTAKVTTYSAGKLVNDVCVDAQEVTGTPDDCDDATVEVDEPKVDVCNPTTGKIIRVPVSEKDKYEDKDSPKCKPVKVCDPTTGKIIYVPYKDKDQYEPADSEKCQNVRVCDPTTGIEKDVPYKDKDNYLPVGSKECGKIRVCDPTTGQIIDVDYKDKDSYAPENSEKCQDVMVCDPTTGIETNVPYKDKDQYLPVGSKECGMIKVCDQTSGKIINVPYKDKDQYKDVADAACQPKPEEPKTPEEPELPAELPKTGFADALQAIIGMGSLTAAGYYYIASRKQ